MKENQLNEKLDKSQFTTVKNIEDIKQNIENNINDENNIIHQDNSNVNNKTDISNNKKEPIIESTTEFSSKNRLFIPNEYRKMYDKEKIHKYKETKKTFMYKDMYESDDSSSGSQKIRKSHKLNKSIAKIRFYLIYFSLCLLFVYLLIHLVKCDKIFEKGPLTVDMFYLIVLMFLLNLMLILSLNSFGACLIYLKEILIVITIAAYVYLLIKVVKEGVLQKQITEKIFYMQIIIFFIFIILYFKN